jgi:hypothetical protein
MAINDNDDENNFIDQLHQVSVRLRTSAPMICRRRIHARLPLRDDSDCNQILESVDSIGRVVEEKTTPAAAEEDHTPLPVVIRRTVGVLDE